MATYCHHSVWDSNGC